MKCFLALLLSLSLAWGLPVRRRVKFPRSPIARLKARQTSSELPTYEYKELWFNQTTDHFGYITKSAVPPTFLQKILVNDTWWRAPDGPVLFYTGNEGNIESFAQNTGFMWQLAPRLGALVVFAEHRYYGASTPYPIAEAFAYPPDPEKLKYLTVEQALADFVADIEFLRSEYKMSKEAAVIAMGGSYGGMLSAYLRAKYPWAVDGALASSAPVLQFPGLMPGGDINAFFNIVTRDFSQYPGCAEAIRLSWSVIDRLAGQNLEKFQGVFNLCEPLEDFDDVDYLKDWISEAYIYMAMTDYQYPTSFLRPLPGEPIQEACRAFTSSKGQPPDDPYVLLRQVLGAIQVFYNYTGTCNCQCFDLFGGGGIDVGDMGWDYQSCTQFVMPMAADGRKDMFYSQPWDMQAVFNHCEASWGVKPDVSWGRLQMGGGHYEAASNIIFSNGGRDPWSGGGITEDLSDSVVALFVPEGAHHLDLRSDNPRDPISVRRVRDREERIIRGWIRERRDRERGGGPRGVIGGGPAMGIGFLLGIIACVLVSATGVFVTNLRKLAVPRRPAAGAYSAHPTEGGVREPLLSGQPQPAPQPAAVAGGAAGQPQGGDAA